MEHAERHTGSPPDSTLLQAPTMQRATSTRALKTSRSPSALLLSGATFLLLFALAPSAEAGTPNVAIVAGDSAANTGDAQAKLAGTGLFGQVDVILTISQTPTLAQLQAYSAVMVWSNSSFQDATLLGDVLADYVDGGGGVVVTVFCNSTTTLARTLQGRWVTGNYPVIVHQGGTTSGTGGGGPQSLGTVHQPAHPVMAGVTTFHGGNFSYRPTTTSMTAGSSVVAEWTDGKILVAQHGTYANRVDLGMFPPSSTLSASNWTVTTDGARLMANALLHTGSQVSSSTPFCFGDGTGNPCPCGNVGAAGNGCASSINANGANITTTGAASLASDTLVLVGSGMPDSSALYFQGMSQQSGGLGVFFGDGLRCAGGAVARLKTVTNSGGASQFPQGGDPTVSVKGAVLVPGTRTYQVWYRNAAAFCTASTFNLSNGVEVLWH